MNNRSLTSSQSIVIRFASLVALSGVAVIIHYLLEDIRNNLFVARQFFMYFTIQTGLAFAAMQLIYTIGAAWQQHRIGRRQSTSWQTSLDVARYCLTVYAAIILPIYWLVVEPPGSWQFDNWWIVIHLVLPVVATASWWIVPPRAYPAWWWPLVAMTYPVLFAVASVLLGAQSGWYPYPFLDPSVSGQGGVVGWIALLAVGACLIGVLFWLPYRLIRRKQM